MTQATAGGGGGAEPVFCRTFVAHRVFRLGGKGLWVRPALKNAPEGETCENEHSRDGSSLSPISLPVRQRLSVVLESIYVIFEPLL